MKKLLLALLIGNSLWGYSSKEELENQIKIYQAKIQRLLNAIPTVTPLLNKIERLQDQIDDLYHHEKIIPLQQQVRTLQAALCSQIAAHPEAQEIQKKIHDLKQTIIRVTAHEREEAKKLTDQLYQTNIYNGGYSDETVFDDEIEDSLERKIALLNTSIKQKSAAYEEEIEILRDRLLHLIGQDNNELTHLSRQLDYKLHKIADRMKFTSSTLEKNIEKLDAALPEKARCRIECLQRRIQLLTNELKLHYPCLVSSTARIPRLFDQRYLGVPS